MYDEFVEKMLSKVEVVGNTVEGYEVKPLILRYESNKWLVRSALQKCIRRGYTKLAIDYASYLFHENEAKVFKDLSIIAIEDVGIGDPDAVSLALLLDKKKAYRSRHHEPLVTLAIAVYLLSESQVKNRGMCELSLGGDIIKGRFRELSPEQQEWIDELKFNWSWLHVELEVYEEVLRIRGKLDAPKDQKELDKLIESYKTLSEEDQRLCVLALDRAHDSMFCATHSVMWMAVNGAPAVHLNHEFPPEIKIKGVPSCAYDRHNMQGKKAIAAFCTHMSKEHKVFRHLNPDTRVDQIGSIVFTEEGGLCSNHASYFNIHRNHRLIEFQDTLFHLATGLPVAGSRKAEYEELRHLVRNNIDVLNQKREWAAKL